MTVSTPIGRACGKVILLGEHFVVHGAPALAAPLLAWEVEVTLLEDATSIDAPGVSPNDVREAVALASAVWGLPEPGIRVRASLPIGVGLGSSAAFATALVRALAQTLPAPVAPAEQARVVHLLEARVHGTPSGLDAAVVGSERLIRFVPGVAPRPINAGAELHLVVADSGTPGSTAEQVMRVSEFARARPERFRLLLGEASEDVDTAIAGIASGNIDALGSCMDAAHARLVECGVSTPALERLVLASREAGALGAKLTGAGGGGATVALSPGADTHRIEDALTKAGARHVMVTTLKGGEAS